MAKWSLVCPRCNHKFTHIKINEAVVAEAYRDSYGTDAKPELPEKQLTCPYCQMESLYGRFHLIYEEDRDETAKDKGA
jgi:DNA-directed RNA polymerase subunit RPC12/RpoP